MGRRRLLSTDLNNAEYELFYEDRNARTHTEFLVRHTECKQNCLLTTKLTRALLKLIPTFSRDRQPQFVSATGDIFTICSYTGKKSSECHAPEVKRLQAYTRTERSNHVTDSFTSLNNGSPLQSEHRGRQQHTIRACS